MAFAGGDGSSGNPWQIETAQQLNDLRLYVGVAHADKYFILNNDIDLTTFLAPAGAGYNAGQFWDPIPDFWGNFNGKNHSITHLKINRPSGALFRLLNGNGTYHATVENVRIATDTITGITSTSFILHEGCAILAMYVTGDAVVFNVHAAGKINTNNEGFVGGLITFLIGVTHSPYIIGCSSKVTITSTYLGGSIGYIGGLIGSLNRGKVYVCESKATITGTLDTYVGGFVGRLENAVIKDCHVGNFITGSRTAGGFVCIVDGDYELGVMIERCYATGTIDVANLGGGGGFCAATKGGHFNDCYSKVAVSGLGSSVSGFCYSVRATTLADHGVNISRCFCAGPLSGKVGITDLTGFANDKSTAGVPVFSNNYWDTDVTGTLVSDLATGKTTVELKQEVEYSGFDFLTTWQIDTLGVISGGYAYLKHALRYATRLLNPTAPRDYSPTIQLVNTNSNGSPETVSKPMHPCYGFLEWEDGGVANPRTDLAVRKSQAHYAYCIEVSGHVLTYTAGVNGSISGITPQIVADGADGTSVLAVPNANYAFDQWSDGVTDNPRTDTNVTGDITVTAIFVRLWALVYSSGVGGSIIGDTHQVVEEGSDGTPVTAVNALGYVFDQWSDGVTDNPRQDLNVSSSLLATAIFLEEFILTYNAGIGGSVTGITPQTVPSGQDGTPVTAVNALGYVFDQWSDGVTDNPRQDELIISNINVTATFLATTHRLLYTADYGGSLTGVTDQIVGNGTDGSMVVAVPATGYKFVGWDDGNPNPNRVDFIVIMDITTQAQFVQYTNKLCGTVLLYTPVPAPVTFNVVSECWELDAENPEAFLISVNDDKTGVIYFPGSTIPETGATFLELEFTCVPTSAGMRYGYAELDTDDPNPYVAGYTIDLLCEAFSNDLTLRLESNSKYRFGVWASSIYRVPENAAWYASNTVSTKRTYSPGDIVTVDPWAAELYLYDSKSATEPVYTYVIQQDPMPYWNPNIALPLQFTIAMDKLLPHEFEFLTNKRPQYTRSGDIEVHALLSLHENAVALGYIKTPYTTVLSWRSIPYTNWDLDAYTYDDPADNLDKTIWSDEEKTAYIMVELLKKVGWYNG